LTLILWNKTYHANSRPSISCLLSMLLKILTRAPWISKYWTACSRGVAHRSLSKELLVSTATELEEKDDSFNDYDLEVERMRLLYELSSSFIATPLCNAKSGPHPHLSKLMPDYGYSNTLLLGEILDQAKLTSLQIHARGHINALLLGKIIDQGFTPPSPNSHHNIPTQIHYCWTKY